MCGGVAQPRPSLKDAVKISATVISAMGKYPIFRGEKVPYLEGQ